VTGDHEADHDARSFGEDLTAEIDRLRAELADERKRRIAAEALVKEQEQALESARRAARYRSVAAPSVPAPEISIRRRTLLRGNWLQ
jgi:hypothetical protein